jgi:hypothetical protein
MSHNTTANQQTSAANFGNFTYTTYLPAGNGNTMIGTVGMGGAGGAYSAITSTFTNQSASVITLTNNGQEIVRLNQDGTVIWAKGIDIDEAAIAFEKALIYSAELKAGITQTVKFSMRDSVFESLISIAKEKGPLSVEDLTYLLEASKIIEKLKGGTGEK